MVPDPMSQKSKADSSAAAASSLPAEIVDGSVLDALIEKTKVERQLESFRTRAQEKKGKVDAAVSARVLSDYDTRLRALRAEAEPLRARARTEWEKLRGLYTEVGSREDRAKLDKQELEFRHEVGEIDDAVLNERVKASTDVLETCRADVAALDKQKARFLEAFTEAELTAPPPPKPVETIKAVVAPDEAVTIETPRPTMKTPAPEERSVRVPVASPFSSEATFTDTGDATMLGPMPVLTDPAEEEGTLILPEGALVVLNADGKEGHKHRLSAMTYIGRAEENQIRIQGEGVSRRHALVVAERAGFRIDDLGSQNGTLVNGKVMQRGMLANGDIITLGVVKLRFEQPSGRK